MNVELIKPKKKDMDKEVKKVIESMKLESKTNVKTLEQPKNTDFRKIKETPILKKGTGIFGRIKKDKTYVKQEIKDGKIKESSYKTPLLEMIRADGRIEWYEGAKAGTLQINRSDEKVAYIDLRKDKLLTDSIRNNDGTVVQKWICYENDQNPLPANNYMDSHGYFSNLEEIMMAKKDWKTEQLRARGDLYMQIFIGIAIILAVLFVVAPMFGFNVIEEISKAQDDEPVAQVTTYTPEEQMAINQIISQMRAQDAGDSNA